VWRAARRGHRRSAARYARAFTTTAAGSTSVVIRPGRYLLARHIHHPLTRGGPTNGVRSPRADRTPRSCVSEIPRPVSRPARDRDAVQPRRHPPSPAPTQPPASSQSVLLQQSPQHAQSQVFRSSASSTQTMRRAIMRHKSEPHESPLCGINWKWRRACDVVSGVGHEGRAAPHPMPAAPGHDAPTPTLIATPGILPGSTPTPPARRRSPNPPAGRALRARARPKGDARRTTRAGRRWRRPECRSMITAPLASGARTAIAACYARVCS
jgi:hypothetical protein